MSWLVLPLAALAVGLACWGMVGLIFFIRWVLMRFFGVSYERFDEAFAQGADDYGK